MKKLIQWSVFLLFAGSLMGQGANNVVVKNTPSPIVVIYLSDGSRVVGTPVFDPLKIKTKYATMGFQFSKVCSIEFSGTSSDAQVELQNGDLLKGQLALMQIAMKANSGEVMVPLVRMNRLLVRAGSMGGDFVNSLGMEFVTVPGTKVLFSIWDTRVQDYRAYNDANPGVDASWKDPGFKQAEDHPVVCVSWDDANAFCTWLTHKERNEGKIRRDQEYRLPTDDEWSVAIGKCKYPWGAEWPPPKGAGNYSPTFKADDYDYTSPVGGFKANIYGLFDMGGNVWQWCADLYRGDMNEGLLAKYPHLRDKPMCRAARGASWNTDDPVMLLSSYRGADAPNSRPSFSGFRCVLAVRSQSSNMTSLHRTPIELKEKGIYGDFFRIPPLGLGIRQSQ